MRKTRRAVQVTVTVSDVTRSADSTSLSVWPREAATGEQRLQAEDLSNLSELEDGGLEDGEDGEDAAEASGALRGFTISGKMEKEYARLMNQTQKELGGETVPHPGMPFRRPLSGTASSSAEFALSPPSGC